MYPGVSFLALGSRSFLRWKMKKASKNEGVARGGVHVLIKGIQWLE